MNFMHSMRRFAAPLGVVAVAAIALTGCVAADSGEANDRASQTISIAGWDPENLIPGNTYAFQLSTLLYSTLLRLDAETGEINNLVAETVESEDQKIWNITLEDGWTFHNGEAVTAQSFADAWNATAYGPNAWIQNSYFANIEGYADLNPADGSTPAVDTLSGVDVVSDLELTVTLTEPNGLFPYTLANFALSPLPSVAFDDLEAFSKSPIGNGAYELSGSYTVNDTVSLVRYENYAGAAAATKYLDFVPYTNFSTAYNDVLAGSVDLVYPVPPERLSDVESSFGDSRAESPIPNLNYLAFPMWEERFQDADIRRALSMAIDRESIVKTILQGAGQAAYGMAPQSAEGARANTCEFCVYDPEAAKELLASAGGWEGPMTLWASSYGNNDQILQAVANQLKNNLGIEDITFELGENVYQQVMNKENDGPSLEYWGAFFPHIQAMVEPFYGTTGAGNVTGYSNAEVDELLARGDATSGAEAIEFYQQAEDIALKDMFVAPLYFQTFTAVWSDRIQSVPVGPQGFGDLTTLKLAN